MNFDIARTASLYYTNHGTTLFIAQTDSGGLTSLHANPGYLSIMKLVKQEKRQQE
jgi:hypothetical protein